LTFISASLSTDELKHFLGKAGLARPDGELYANQREKFQEVSALVNSW